MTKEEVIFLLSHCVEDYKKELQNRNLLFLYIDKYLNSFALETVFLSKHFKHLTGVQSNLKANRFYQKLLNHTLDKNDFDLRQDGTTELKLSVFPTLLKKNLSANMIGDFFDKNTRLYTEKIAGRLYGSMGFIYDQSVNRYIPNTVLHEDLRDLVKTTKRIIATFRKRINEQKYSELVFKLNTIDWNNINLPSGYEYLSKYLFEDKSVKLSHSNSNYFHHFPDFDDDNTIKALKGWKDVSKVEDEMPSFEKKGKNGHIYRIKVNYPLSCDWKVHLPDNRRFELLKDEQHVESFNDLDLLLREYKKLSKQNNYVQ